FSSSFSQNAYLPDIALILNMSTVSRDVKNSDYSDFTIPGFVDADDNGDSTGNLPFNKSEGFNLNYAELGIHSVIDPYFEAYAHFHLHTDEFEIGEAYVVTRSLPASLRVKTGKFKSSFGRINEKHQHSWNFDEQPIIYKSLFGPDSISDAGIQLQWVMPTDIYAMAGIEALQGTNGRSFGDDNGNLFVGYLKSSLDITDDFSVLAGASLAHGQTDEQKPSNVYGVDLTLREQLGSYSSLVWQSEYLKRNKDVIDGTETVTDKQAGLYTQVVYQYNNNYSFGLMYDLITENDTDLSDYDGIDTDNLQRYTAMLEYKPFPFSRLRLEYSFDQTKIIDDKRQDVNTVMLTFNLAAGAHGAHSY
ncbi:MAG: hypothetical protein ACJAWW_002877, partial [Sulfurimonas sp.]